MRNLTRRDVSAATRHNLHLTRLNEAADAADELAVATGWFRAEALRVMRPDDATRAVLGLVVLMREGGPIPQELLEAARRITEPTDQPSGSLGGPNTADRGRA